MPRRVIAAVVAGLLALVGAGVLVLWVNQADARAMARLDTVDVLVATQAIPEGTESAALKSLVELTTLPAAAVAPGALASLDGIEGLAATADILPGEQLLADRFANPATLTPTDAVEVPTGLQEVSVLLDAPRVVGGRIQAGDHVGVFISLTDPSQTSLRLQKVLVTRVQGGAVVDDAADDGVTPIPEGNVLVTVALGTHDAERLVFAAEHGTVWLSLQNDATATDGAAVVSEENVYQ